MRMAGTSNRSENRAGASGGDAASSTAHKNANGNRFGGSKPSTPVNIFTGTSGTSATGSMPNGGVGAVGGAGSRPTADYNRSHFVNMGTTSPSNNATSGNAAGNGFGDMFADILGEQGYKFSQKAHQSPRSINDMRKVERTRDMDPNQALILEWVWFYYFLLL